MGWRSGWSHLRSPSGLRNLLECSGVATLQSGRRLLLLQKYYSCILRSTGELEGTRKYHKTNASCPQSFKNTLPVQKRLEMIEHLLTVRSAKQLGSFGATLFFISLH